MDEMVRKKSNVSENQDKWDDLEIQLEPISREIKRKKEPEYGHLHSLIVPDDHIKIYLKEGIWPKMMDYFKTNIKNEMGGVLIGDLYESLEDKSKFIEIEDFIEAPSEKKTSTTFTFTHAAWEYVNHKRDSLYPELKIVGWVHSHPRMSVFMSGYDTFIHKNFFNLPWNVALVMEPVSEKGGFFRLEGNEVVKCPELSSLLPIWARELQKRIEELEKKKQEPIPVPIPARGWKVMIGLSVICIVLAVGLIADRFFLVNRFNNEFQKMSETAEIQENKIASLVGQIKNLELEKEREPIEPSPKFVSIEIKKGDILWAICEEYLGNKTRYNEVAKLNNLKDPNKIYPGQIILLPSK